MELAMRAMGGLLPKLGELLKEEYGLQRGVKKKIEKLSQELDAAHTVLRDISDVPQDQLNELVKLWARDVREASYDMEDIIDTFLVHVDNPKPADPHMLQRFTRKVTTLFKKSKTRHNISSQIQEIYKKLEELAARRDRYNTPDSFVNTNPATTIDPRIVNLYKSATELVGIEGPKDELIDILSLRDDCDGDVPDNKKMKIVSVVGFGGLGKTTLAKAVYDRLKAQFNWGAFVPVGRNPDIKKVLRDILIGLDKEKSMNLMNLTMLDEKQLMDELKEFIKEKRYFIVIDDIWDKKSWKLIRCALQESNCGSRLVITTRISEVATYAGLAYKMQPLSHDNSRKLLCARIVDGEGKYFDSPSTDACERILKKCGGVPLAIITIASLLANKPWEVWSEVYNSIGFGHEGNDDVENTRRILSFSYYDLPSNLKSCLLYLSVFPEDDVIEKNSLIWKWIAEGFITLEQAAKAGVGLFELGERYFNELINRNMIQPQETRYNKGYVDACSVHDMVLDLIHQLSNEENFVTILNGGERPKLQGGISRRLALQRVEEHNVGQLANIAVEKVRSIFASRCDFCALFPRLPFLHVVDMVRCSVSQECDKDVPGLLGRLLHLRYLRLESTTKLPREIRYLKFLQTLDLRNSNIEELPVEVGLLTQLLCLQANPGVGVPAGLIGKLTSLQELGISGFGGEEATMQFVKELGLLRELRVLSTRIHVWTDSIESALQGSLCDLHNIQELRIFGPFLSKNWVSDAGWISSPHLRLLEFDYCFRFSELPAWIKLPLTPNLSYLDVQVVVVKEQDMETLARLPELRCLVLHSIDTKLVRIKIRAESVGYFRRLRTLQIYGPFIRFDLLGSECSSRVASNTIMPSLESLRLDVQVRSLKDENLQLGFDKLLGGFLNLGISSLQEVTVYVHCKGARIWEVEEAEVALTNAAQVHPKDPNLLTIIREEPQHIISPYQEACFPAELIIKSWNLAVGSKDIEAHRMPDPAASSSKVIRLLYTNDGVGLLALSSNAVHKLWKWEPRNKNPRGKVRKNKKKKNPRGGKSSKSVRPVLWQPESGIVMINDTTDGNPEIASGCVALSENGNYIISASGGKVSSFDIMTFKVRTTFMPPPPAATFLALHPQYNNIIAIGRDDSSIQIYNVHEDKAISELKGHQKKITGLAFSLSMNVLVSSGADAQLCVWNANILNKHVWEKKKSRYIQHPSNRSEAQVGDTMVQFHYDGTRILVVHETQLAIYDWQLECLCSWFPRDELPAPISSAVYSLGCLLVYAGFYDGAIGIFEAESLTLQCRIAPSTYLPSSVSGGGIVYPTVVATHPWKRCQIAVGMSDGAVHVLEPLDTGDVETDLQRPVYGISCWSSSDTQLSDQPMR